jgi:hypothetical protein
MRHAKSVLLRFRITKKQISATPFLIVLNESAI